MRVDATRKRDAASADRQPSIDATRRARDKRARRTLCATRRARREEGRDAGRGIPETKGIQTPKRADASTRRDATRAALDNVE